MFWKMMWNKNIIEKKKIKLNVYYKFWNIIKDCDLFLDKSILFIFEIVIYN